MTKPLVKHTPANRKITGLAGGARLAAALALIAAPALETGAEELAQASVSRSSLGQVSLNFSDVSLRDFITSMAAVTDRNFIIDPRVVGRVTIVSSRPLPMDAVYEAFLAVLEINGFTAITTGDLTRIVPLPSARESGGARLLDDGERGGRQGIVLRLVELVNVTPAHLLPVLRPLLPQHAHLASIPGTNLLMIGDNGANVERLLAVIERVDRASDEEIEIIPVENLSVAAAHRMLTSLIAAMPRDGGRPVVVLPDERTRSLIAAGDRGTRLKLRALMAHIDVPAAERRDIERLQLRYVKAEDLIKVIDAYLAKGILQSLTGEKEAATSGIAIVPEPNTETLLVTAPPKVMAVLKDLVAGLDVRPKQVLVEAIIVELSSDKSAELGITWASVPSDGGDVLGLTNFSRSGFGVAQAVAAGEAAAANPPDGLTLAAGRIKSGTLSFAGLLRALAGDSGSNVLSAPVVLTMDRREATISVGQEVPFVTGSFTGVGSGAGSEPNPFQTIQRKEVGVTLKVTPRINTAGSITLDIEQEVSSLAGTSTGAVDLVTNKRRLQTSVLADDGDFIVLGGLIDDAVVESNQRVPLLGDIPLFGALFKYSRTTKTKRNLMMFLKPTVLADVQDAHDVSASEYDRLSRLLKERGDVSLLVSERQPQLPPLQAPETLPAPAPAPAPAPDSEEPARETVQPPDAPLPLEMPPDEVAGRREHEPEPPVPEIVMPPE